MSVQHLVDSPGSFLHGPEGIQCYVELHEQTSIRCVFLLVSGRFQAVCSRHFKHFVQPEGSEQNPGGTP